MTSSFIFDLLLLSKKKQVSWEEVLEFHGASNQ